MKKIILLSTISLIMQGCYKMDDDTENICHIDCTIIEGNFLSVNDEPVENVKIKLDYKISSPPFGLQIRKIKNTRTDENGYYNMEFYIQDNELGETAEGYFRCQIDMGNINQNKYLIPRNIQLSDAIFVINRRDTIINRTFYIPHKAFIKVNLNNFYPIQERDFFEVRTLFPFGFRIGLNDFLDTEYGTGMSGYGNFLVSGLNAQFDNVFVAENEMNIIRIARRKNGVTTLEDFEIFIPENNNIELTYEY